MDNLVKSGLLTSHENQLPVHLKPVLGILQYKEKVFSGASSTGWVESETSYTPFSGCLNGSMVVLQHISREAGLSSAHTNPHDRPDCRLRRNNRSSRLFS
jgi:hypothetical protein